MAVGKRGGGPTSPRADALGPLHAEATCGHIPVVHNTSTQEALALQQEARLFPQ